MHCLPSQLEKEDATTISKFVIIENEIRRQEEEANRRAMNEAKLRSMM
jgi:hypothetical protein